MTPQRLLVANALFTAIGAAGMLAARAWTPPLFGLDGPILLDILGIALLLYAGGVAVIARRPPIDRQTMMAFAIADSLWVAGSVAVLLLFWPQLTPLGRALIIVVAVAVDVFATVQFRAARHAAAATTSRTALF